MGKYDDTNIDADSDWEVSHHNDNRTASEHGELYTNGDGNRNR